MAIKRIVVVPVAVYDPFFQQVREGVEAARDALGDKGVEVEWLEEEEARIERQMDVLEKLQSENVHGIVICPLDPNRLNRSIEKCVQRGISVATFCLDAPESGRMFHVGQDMRQGGRVAGSLLGKFMGGRGQVGIITGFFNVPGHEERRKGCVEVLHQDYPDIRVVWEEENHDRWEEAHEIVVRRLKEGGIGGLYITAGGPFGAAGAVEEAGQGGKIRIVCFDFVPQTVDCIRRGFIDAAIGQEPFAQGYDSVMAVYDYISLGKKPVSPIKRVRLDIGVKENVACFGIGELSI